MIAAAIYNANPFRDKDAPIVTAEDFAPDPGSHGANAPQEPSEEEKLEQFKQFFKSMKKSAG